MCADVGGFLRTWQELIGAMIGGAMGFGGAYVLAKTQEGAQVRSAARILSIVHEGYIGSAKRFLKHENAMDVLIEPDFLPKMLQEKPLEITPLYLPNRERLSAFDNDDLHEHLQLFYLNSLQIEKKFNLLMLMGRSSPEKSEVLNALREALLATAYNAVCANYLLNKYIIKKNFEKNQVLENNYKIYNGTLQYSAEGDKTN